MSKIDKEEKERVVVIFIEGETEIEFYKRFISIMRTHCDGRLTCSVEIVNASGIGQYKDKVLRIFEKRIKKKYPADRLMWHCVMTKMYLKWGKILLLTGKK